VELHFTFPSFIKYPFFYSLPNLQVLKLSQINFMIPYSLNPNPIELVYSFPMPKELHITKCECREEKITLLL
jgi:hypothetical protein